MSTVLENPLLNYGEFVDYKSIRAEHIVPAIKVAVQRAKAKLESALAVKDSSEELTFNNTLYTLMEIDEDLEKAWTPVENLLSLKGEPAIRAAAEEARPMMVEFYNEYSLDPRVFELVKSYSETQEAINLTGLYKRYLDSSLTDFKLAGAMLGDEDKKEFKQLSLELSQLSQQFSNNATDSKFELVLKEDQLGGLSEDVLQAAKQKANELGRKDSWVFNLDYPSFMPFMKFSDSSELRKKLYIEYLNKATFGKVNTKGDNLNNEPLIYDIFAKKSRKAKLLGFKNYAELSLETKMAPSPEKVKSFLENLASKARPLAEKERDALIEFQKEINYVNSENNPDKLYPWDQSYLSEKLRKSKYELDSNEIKQYFELKSCVSGLFELAEEIFSIEFRENKSISTWNDEVQVFDVYNRVSDLNPLKEASKLGTFYMDLHPRDTKRQGAWVMPLVQGGTGLDGQKVLPQCALVCNLVREQSEPSYLPALLSHMELVTLFHEFGHAMHHLLSDVELAPLSGTNVEWDFVELPSQLMENFCWEKESLARFAKHYETKAVIPTELLEKMLAARNFNEGLACIRQVEFGLFDLAIYMTTEEQLAKKPREIYFDITNQYGVIEQSSETNFPNAFGHIFAGGYSAGYYSYKWAEVLEADAFGIFQDAGVVNAEVGIKYRNTILKKGDSQPPMEIFKEFVGREPNEDALIARMGL